MRSPIIALIFFAFLLALLVAYIIAVVVMIVKIIKRKDGYIPMLFHVLLLIFNLPVWYFIWNYKTTYCLNNLPGEEDRGPVKKLLLCIFIPFYNIYWTYKSAQRIDKKAALTGVSSNIATLCLVLGIFIPVLAYIIMQNKLNVIVKASK